MSAKFSRPSRLLTEVQGSARLLRICTDKFLKCFRPAWSLPGDDRVFRQRLHHLVEICKRQSSAVITLAASIRTISFEEPAQHNQVPAAKSPSNPKRPGRPATFSPMNGSENGPFKAPLSIQRDRRSGHAQCLQGRH